MNDFMVLSNLKLDSLNSKFYTFLPLKGMSVKGVKVLNTLKLSGAGMNLSSKLRPVRASFKNFLQ